MSTRRVDALPSWLLGLALGVAGFPSENGAQSRDLFHPAAGGELVLVEPGPGEPDAFPDRIRIVHRDGQVPWDSGSLVLSVDGEVVTFNLARSPGETTLVHVRLEPFAPGSFHTANLRYPVPHGDTGVLRWEFTVGDSTRDSVMRERAVVARGGRISDDGFGRTSRTGDGALILPRAGACLHREDLGELTQLRDSSGMTVSFWAAVWQGPACAGPLEFQLGASRSSSQAPAIRGGVDGAQRRMWLSCGTGMTQVLGGPDLSAALRPAAGSSSPWHHFAFVMRGPHHELWVDGRPVAETSASGAIEGAVDRVWLGLNETAEACAGVRVDDFSLFALPLAPAAIRALALGVPPMNLPVSSQPLCCWEFNDRPQPEVFVRAPSGQPSAPAHRRAGRVRARCGILPHSQCARACASSRS